MATRGSAPDSNTSCQPLAQSAEGRQPGSIAEGTPQSNACTRHKVCVAAGAVALLRGFVEGIKAVMFLVRTDAMVADIFTKPLDKTAFLRCRDYLMAMTE